MRPLRPFVIILLLTLVAVVAYLVSATPASPEPSVPTSTTAAQAPPPASAPAPTSTTAAPAPPPTAPQPSQALSGASQGTPAPTPPQPAAPAITGCRWEQAIRDIWPDDSEEWALSIVWRESRCTETAVSPTGCRGLWQLALPMHADLFAAQGLDWQTSWSDPVANTRAALFLFQSSGTSPWKL